MSEPKWPPARSHRITAAPRHRGTAHYGSYLSDERRIQLFGGEHPLERHADFLQQNVRHHGGGAGVVMQLDHRSPNPNRRAPLSQPMRRAVSGGSSPSHTR